MSGIYIKGMEMPKNCLDCPCCDDMGGAYCRPLQKKLGLAFASLYKPDDCPLIEVPKHGDLIDRDAIKETFCGNCFADEKPMECPEPCMDMRIILDASTIIPASEEGET